MILAPTERGREFASRVRAFLRERLAPVEAEVLAGLRRDPWVEPEALLALRRAAREQGLWNLFLPDPDLAPGLSVLDYAPVAEEMGFSPLAPDLFNCNAPDTGNMEVLWKYGSEAQRERWLEPLLAGEIRSAFCMTEPGVASSDATNMAATARIEGREVRIDGRKWWSTGLGHPRCRLLLFMGLTDAEAPRHRQHSIVLLPVDTPGVRIERMLTVFGDADPPYGHGEVSFDDVRVPLENIVAGPGRGFEIAQGRLGPGRIHHCMRLIGAAERALGLACRRAQDRTAFGRPLARLGGNMERIAEARIAIDQARLLTLHAAGRIDAVGARQAMSEISQIKVAVPRMAQDVIDMAIQLHGGAGLHHDLPLAALYAGARSLRLADGPDEVHRHLVAKLELARQADEHGGRA